MRGKKQKERRDGQEKYRKNCQKASSGKFRERHAGERETEEVAGGNRN